MLKWFKQLDKILRGDATRIPLLTEGQFTTPVAGLSVATVLLGVFYGLCVGMFAMIRTGGEAYMQMIASAVKVPFLLMGTFTLSLPSFLWLIRFLDCVRTFRTLCGLCWQHRRG